MYHAITNYAFFTETGQQSEIEMCLQQTQSVSYFSASKGVLFAMRLHQLSGTKSLPRTTVDGVCRYGCITALNNKNLITLSYL